MGQRVPLLSPIHILSSFSTEMHFRRNNSFLSTIFMFSLILPSSLIQSIKDDNGEINVIDLVETSEDPYNVFHEKKGGGFTLEELETHFQTLSDLISSDESVEPERKDAAIKKLEKMRDQLANDIKEDKEPDTGPEEDAVPAEEDIPENGPLADAETPEKNEEPSKEEGEREDDGPPNEVVPNDLEDNENGNEEGPTEEMAGGDKKEEEEEGEKPERGKDEGEDGPSEGVEDADPDELGPHEANENRREEKKEENKEEEDEEKPEEDGPNESEHNVGGAGNGEEDGPPVEDERQKPNPAMESSEPDDGPMPDGKEEEEENRRHGGEEADESGPSEGPDESEEWNSAQGPDEEGGGKEVRTTTAPTSRRRKPGDIGRNCRRHIHQCFQEEYKAGMAFYCKGTCGELGKRNVDIGTNCRALAREGLCSDGTWGEKMDKYCHRSCTRLRG